MLDKQSTIAQSPPVRPARKPGIIFLCSSLSHYNALMEMAINSSIPVASFGHPKTRDTTSVYRRQIRPSLII